MLHWCQNSRRRSSETVGPVVAPQITSAPAPAQRPQRLLPGALAHAVHHHVGAAAAGQPATSATTSAVRVVDRRRRPEPPRDLELGVGAAGHDRPARRAARRSGAPPCATPPPMPQISTVSPARSRARVVQHPPRGERRQREGGRLGPRHARPAPARGSRPAPRHARRRCPDGARPGSRKSGRATPRPPGRRRSVRTRRPGLIITRSPGRTPVTAAPTASTTPAPSEPTTWGKVIVSPAGRRRRRGRAG